MQKRIVGLFANYNASEKTLCAMYLAKHVIHRYRHVVWVVPDDVSSKSPYFGFSHKWDASVKSLQSKGAEIKKQLASWEMCIFFEENEVLYSFLPAVAKTAVFIDPYTWNPDSSRSFVKKCTYALAVSPYVTNQIIQPHTLFNHLLCPFDSTLQLIPKAYFSSGQTAVLFYPAYGMSFLERQCIQHVSEIVKECCPDTKSVIGYYDANETPELGRDARTFDWKLMDYLKQTDWIVDLNPRPLMGLFGSFAGALNIQWSCFDIPPNNDEYNEARRHLIPYPKGGLTLENADKIAEEIVRHLMMPFRDDIDRNKRAGSYSKRILEFTRAMNKLFDAKSR